MRALTIAALVIVTQGLDLITSIHGFEVGAREMNPLIHNITDLVMAKVVATVLVLIALFFSRAYPLTREAVNVAAVFMSGATMAAVLGNLNL